MSVGGVSVLDMEFLFKDGNNRRVSGYVIREKLRFKEAVRHCERHSRKRLELAVGYTLVEMLALTKAATSAGIRKSEKMLLGISRSKADPIYQSVHWVPFGPDFAPFQPDELADESVAGCVSSLYKSRADCKPMMQPFACAIYTKVPPNIGGRST